MSVGNLEFDPADAAAAVDLIDEAGQSIFDQAGLVEVAPDAGSSTDEVVDAAQSLALAVAALASDVGDLARNAAAVAGMLVETDGGIAEGLRAPIPGLRSTP
jgi:hypothetical protein